MNEIQEVANDRMVPMTSYAMGVSEIIDQVNLIQNVMKSVMRDNEHYGVIPGTGKKPSLLKSGAEKLTMTFRMAPRYEITINDMGRGHREYEVVCHLDSLVTGKFLGSGVGNCSTMETKYRYRTGPTESTGKPVPKEYWNLRDKAPDKAKALLGGPGFVTKKFDGKWEIAQQGERVEHDNPADYYNTVKKMGKKRAFVDAVLTVTAASDIFTQDVEDLPAAVPEEPLNDGQEHRHADRAPKPVSEHTDKFFDLCEAHGVAKDDLDVMPKVMEYVKLCAGTKRTTEQIMAAAVTRFEEFWKSFQKFFHETKQSEESTPPTAPGSSVEVSCPDRDGEGVTIEYCETKCQSRSGCPAHDMEKDYS